MCGIAGFVDYKEDVSKSTEVLGAMCDKLSHRGPDSSGIWLDHTAALAHRRLAVIDIENGKQPMKIIKDGITYIIVYNGELYNTEDIRKELLKKGYSFFGHSDTEVLLSAYICWGEKAVEYFNGIYAFAIWNTATRQLFVARDRVGVKTFF